MTAKNELFVENIWMWNWMMTTQQRIWTKMTLDAKPWITTVPIQNAATTKMHTPKTEKLRIINSKSRNCQLPCDLEDSGALQSPMKSAASDKSRWAAALPTSSGLPSDSCDAKTSMKIIVALFAMKSLKHVSHFLWIHLLIEQKNLINSPQNPVKTIQNLWKNGKKKHELHVYNHKKNYHFCTCWLFPSFPIQPKSTSSVILAQASADLHGCRDFCCWKGKNLPDGILAHRTSVDDWGYPNHLQNAKYLKIPWNHCAKDPDIRKYPDAKDPKLQVPHPSLPISRF